jgi:hypothetical protein
MRRARDAALPPPVRAALEEIFGEGVGHVRVIEHSLYARAHLRAVATTRRGRIYLSGGAAAFFANPSLLLHEYWHVIGQWQRGTLTVPRYLLECLQRGYRNNRFEVEARAFADQKAPQMHALLAGGAWSARPGSEAQPSSASRR